MSDTLGLLTQSFFKFLTIQAGRENEWDSGFKCHRCCRSPCYVVNSRFLIPIALAGVATPLSLTVWSTLTHPILLMDNSFFNRTVCTDLLPRLVSGLFSLLNHNLALFSVFVDASISLPFLSHYFSVTSTGPTSERRILCANIFYISTLDTDQWPSSRYDSRNRKGE